MLFLFFFFNDTATTEIYTLSLHDALPIYLAAQIVAGRLDQKVDQRREGVGFGIGQALDLGELLAAAALDHVGGDRPRRSEEHTSELQSRQYLVCRLLLEKKKQQTQQTTHQ